MESLSLGTVIQGDCLQVMAALPDNSIDLICTDPPYFKVKKEWWDRQWEKPEGFLAWLDLVAEQWRRVLKPNGSLYCFASPKMSARVEVKLAGRFAVINRITWQKPPFATKAEMFVKSDLRGFFPASESIIFCEQYGADSSAKGESGYGAECDKLRGFIFEPLRAYLDGERVGAGATRQQMGLLFAPPPHGEALANHFWRSGQWLLPQPDQYLKLQQAFPGYFTRPYEDLRAEYEDLRRQYEDLRRQYEDLRRPFHVSSEVPYTDVWTFPTVSNYQGKHPCEKPAPLLEHIISASSRPGAVVLDSFAGSGSTLLAAKKLGRQFIGIEIDPHWVDFANRRLGNFSQPTEQAPASFKAPTIQTGADKPQRREDGPQQLTLFA